MHRAAVIMFWLAGAIALPIGSVFLTALFQEGYRLTRRAVQKHTADTIIDACVYLSVSIALLGSALLVADKLIEGAAL